MWAYIPSTLVLLVLGLVWWYHRQTTALATAQVTARQVLAWTIHAQAKTAGMAALYQVIGGDYTAVIQLLQAWQAAVAQLKARAAATPPLLTVWNAPGPSLAAQTKAVILAANNAQYSMGTLLDLTGFSQLSGMLAAAGTPPSVA